MDKMVSFIVEKGGSVDWCVFTTEFPGIKAKKLRKLFEFRQCGKSLEVCINEAVRGITHVECVNQAEDRIVASASLPLSVPLATQRDSDDGTGKIPIKHGTNVLVPAILSSLSPQATEFLVVLCTPQLAPRVLHQVFSEISSVYRCGVYRKMTYTRMRWTVELFACLGLLYLTLVFILVSWSMLTYF